jgi:hypothetical protein
MLRKVMPVIVTLLFCSGLALGQSTFGTLIGIVTDQSGGVVPGATVIVTHLATDTVRRATTDSSGRYELPNLLPGTYNVAVRASGFKELIQKSIPLDPRAIVRVNAVLQIGAATTRLEVTARRPVITTETATVSDIETNYQIERLPINTRAYSTTPLNIITTLPGVQVDSGGVLGAGIMLAGSGPSQSEFSVDGFSTVDVRSNHDDVDAYPSTEAIAEVKVTPELASAESMGMGQVQFFTKSGGNQFHGSLFEYLQNDALDAIPAFAHGKPKVDDNDFGGSISGPVRLPYYNGKDRTFFFFDWESNRQHSATPITENVPTLAMRTGDFSALLPTTQLVSPFTGQPYPNNQIPINPTSANFLKTFYPLPNTQGPGALNTKNNFSQDFAAPVTVNLFDLRIDQNISSKQSVYGRISWQRFTSATPLGLSLGARDVTMNPRAYDFSYSYTITPNLLNEARFGVSPQVTLTTYPNFPDGAALVTQTLGLKQLASPFPPGSAIPGLALQGASGVTSISGVRQEPLTENRYQIADDLTWIRGRHTLKFGLDVRKLRVSDYSNFTGADNFGDFYFNGGYTGNDFADFLLGLPSNTVVVAAGPNYRGLGTEYGIYGEDSIKVTPKLTADMGLRWEYHPALYDQTAQITQFDPKTGGFIVPDAGVKLTSLGFEQAVNACGLPTPVPTPYGLYPCTPMETASQVGIPQALRYGDLTKFLPHLGFAYRISDKTVVRAGGGMYDETLMGDIFNALTSISSSNYQEFFNSFTGGVPQILFPNTESNTPSTGVTYAGGESFGTATDIHLRDPYAEQWALTVERDLGHQTGLRVTYNGMRSVGLIVSPNLNQIAPQTTPYSPTEKPYPNWSQVKTLTNGGSQIYNAMEVDVTHRFSSTFFIDSDWTWAKNLSDAQGDAPTGASFAYGPRLDNHFDLPADYGNVMFDRTQRWLTTAVINIPVGHGRKFGANMNPVLNAIIGGWTTSDIITLTTGPFLTPWYNGPDDPSGTGAPTNGTGQQRPDRLPASVCSGLTQSQGQVFDGNCFYYGWPGPIGRFGNSGVGILTGPGTAVWDLGLSKDFDLTERLKLRFECTSTNFLNHVNYAIPNMTANSSSFGTISGVQTAEGTGARNIQFDIRLSF